MNITASAAGKTRDIDAPRTIEPGKLSLIVQDTRDVELIDQLCPHDQARTYTARRDGNTLIFEESKEQKIDADEQERAKLRAMPPGELQTFAAELQVEWDDKASTETMIDRVFEAWKKVLYEDRAD